MQKITEAHQLHTKLVKQSYVQSWRHTCIHAQATCVAIERAVITYARIARSFSAWIKCQHCRGCDRIRGQSSGLVWACEFSRARTLARTFFHAHTTLKGWNLWSYTWIYFLCIIFQNNRGYFSRGKNTFRLIDGRCLATRKILPQNNKSVVMIDSSVDTGWANNKLADNLIC